MKRIESNIVNVGFTIMNPSQEVKDGQGRSKKVKAQGLEINAAIVNGSNAGVTLRTINGGQKSATISLDTEALEDLLVAVTEVLEANADSEAV